MVHINEVVICICDADLRIAEELVQCSPYNLLDPKSLAKS